MDWKKEFSEGKQYASTAQGMQKKGLVDNETLYNIISLAIERYTSALSSKTNYIPMNSTLVHIFKELSERISLPIHFVEEASFMNRFMVYCSLDVVPVKAISAADITRMIRFMNEVASFTENYEAESPKTIEV